MESLNTDVNIWQNKTNTPEFHRVVVPQETQWNSSGNAHYTAIYFYNIIL